MRWLRRFLARAVNFATRRDDQRLREEIEQHLALQTTDFLRAGMSPEEAHRHAVLKFGPVTAVREHYYIEQGVPLLEKLTMDLRYALRLLAKSPGFTIAAVITLGLGVGANASLFSLIYSLGIRFLPVRDAATLVSIYQQYRGQPHSRGVYGSPYYLSYPEYVHYRDRSTVLSGLSAYAETGLALGGANPRPISGQLVSCNYFQVLGAGFSFGEGFHADDCRASSAPFAVLSHSFWQSRFGGSSTVIGKQLILNGQRVTVAGVAVAGFAGTELQVPDVWLPVTMAPRILPATFGSHDWLALANVSWLQVIGHLKPGISRRQARSELAVLARQMDADYAGRQTVVMVNAGSFVSNPEARTYGVWFSAALFLLGALVLVMACTNLASLLFSRGAKRRQEFVTRLALGCTRRRLVSQLLTENMLLCALGGLAGVAVMLWLTPSLVYVLPGMPSGPLPLNLGPDPVTLAFAFLATVIATLLSGLAPALQATGEDILTALKEGGAAAGHGPRRTRLRDLLVIAQVAGCALLLVLAGLLARGLHRAEVVAPGFATQNVYVISFDLSERGYNGVRAVAFASELRSRLRVVPGVEGVASSEVLPGVNADFTGITIPGAQQSVVQVLVNYVSPDYFTTMKIPGLRGRTFTLEDLPTSGLRPAVINVAMAQQFWPAQNSLGKEFLAGQNQRYEVIGIVPNVCTLHLGQEDGPLFYGLMAGTAGSVDAKTFLRVDENSSAAASAIPAIVRQIDPDVRVTTEPFPQILGEQLLPARRGVVLVSVLGLLALLLAVVGVTGVVSLATSQRVREICIRIAFGARSRDVLVLLLGHGVKLVAIGLAAGVGLATGFAVLLASNGLLFGISPMDPWVLLGTASLLFCSAMSSMIVPAYHVIFIDPAVVLRNE